MGSKGSARKKKKDKENRQQMKGKKLKETVIEERMKFA